MLATHKLKTLEALVREASDAELIWINGYLSGLVAEKARQDTPAVSAAEVLPARITLCYGTETGNAKKLALDFAKQCKLAGLAVQCKGLDQYRFEDLLLEKYFFVVVSTQGEGEPPEPAKPFFQQLFSNTPDLRSMHFGVLALGDTAYPLYCKAGEDLDARLHSLGATRVLPLQKCDVDYAADAAQWFQQVIDRSSNKAAVAATPTVHAAKPKAGGKKYYQGKIIAHINLNDRGSRKETWHIEIRVPEPVDYQPGDAIAIIPENRLEVVERILSLAMVDGNQHFETAKGRFTAVEHLQKQLNICHLLGSTVKKYTALTGHPIPDTRMDLVDLLRIYPLPNPEQFAGLLQILSPIAPRLYSVASSPRLHPQEVHLVVARHRFLSDDSERFGLCSSFLGDQLTGTDIRFYVHHNRAFRLPPPEKDIIMIGPGTGIAPFRGFLQDRDQSGASGRNWFVFGEQHSQTDFLYQLELQQYLQTGVLQKLSLAFSRDQLDKVYVQDRLREEAETLYAWLQRGAYLYISGTKDPMSRDVEKALLEIIEREGAMSAEAALQYLEQCKQEGRYQKDVY